MELYKANNSETTINSRFAADRLRLAVILRSVRDIGIESMVKVQIRSTGSAIEGCRRISYDDIRARAQAPKLHTERSFSECLDNICTLFSCRI